MRVKVACPAQNKCSTEGMAEEICCRATNHSLVAPICSAKGCVADLETSLAIALHAPCPAIGGLSSSALYSVHILALCCREEAGEQGPCSVSASASSARAIPSPDAAHARQFPSSQLRAWTRAKTALYRNPNLTSCVLEDPLI